MFWNPRSLSSVASQKSSFWKFHLWIFPNSCCLRAKRKGENSFLGWGQWGVFKGKKAGALLDLPPLNAMYVASCFSSEGRVTPECSHTRVWVVSTLGPRSLASQAAALVVLCPWDHSVALVVSVFVSQQRLEGGCQGNPPALLAAAGRRRWKETLRANASENSLYCSVAGQRKQIWSDSTLGILQMVSVCPSAAEEHGECTVSFPCRFLLACLCSSEDPSQREFSQLVPCKESIRWLHMMFCFLWHPYVDTDSLPLPSFLLSVIDRTKLLYGLSPGWTMIPHSCLVGSRPKGRSSPPGSPLFVVWAAVLGGASYQSSWGNYAMLLQGFSVVGLF